MAYTEDQLSLLFSSNIKKYRAANGLSQAKLAELTSLSARYISDIEVGKRFPTLATLVKLVNVLNIHPYQLFVDGTVSNSQDSESDRAILKSRVLRAVEAAFLDKSNL